MINYYPIIENSQVLYDKKMTKIPPINQAIGNRIKTAIASLGRGGKTYIAELCEVSNQAITNWEKTGSLTKKNLAIVSNVTGYNLHWLITGQGDPHAPNETEATESTRKYLDGILEACDRAMRSTGRTFTDDEKLSIYLEGIEFAGKRKLSSDLITQYLKEMIKAAK